MGSMPTFGGQARAVVRALFLGASLLLVISLLAACSRPGQASPPSRQQQAQARALAYARCMRAHGVPNYPDPVFKNGGVTTNGPGGDPNSPQYKAAQQACQKYRPGPAQMSPAEQAQARQDGLKLAQCMHSHGFPTFPEPNSQGVIVLQAGDGIDTNSSRYQQAFNHCRKGNIAIQQISPGGSGGS